MTLLLLLLLLRLLLSSLCHKYRIMCKNCMNPKSVDLQLVCVKCRKHDCNVEFRCEERFDWSVECKTV